MAVPMEATPFFGSKISLISKSEIRYEGILYTIDPKESTIALAQVRSFGSEDRIVDKPVPPRDEIYQYIIFRATDIKDLIVDDPPPSPALTDPAIITATTSTTFPSSFPQSSISTGSGSGPQAQSQQQVPSGSQVQQQLQAAATHRPKHEESNKLKASTSGGTSSGHSASSSAAAKSANIMSNLMGGNKPQSGHQSAQRQQPPASQQHLNQQQNRSHGQGPHQGQLNQSRPQGGGGGGGFQRRPPNQPQQGTQPFQQRNGHQPNFRQNQQHQYQGGYQPQNRGFGGQMMRGPMGGFRRGPNLRNNYQPRPVQKNPILESDFDFEKAANEFKVLEEKMGNLKLSNGKGGEVDEGSDDPQENEESKEVCYNKTKSFFDTISCEAIEREKGNNQRVDWKAERKLNRETFGVVNLYRRPQYSRGRGGYMGGYRNYHHSYRPRGHTPNRGSQQHNGGTPKTTPKPNGVTSTTASPAAPSTSAAIVAASPVK